MLAIWHVGLHVAELDRSTAFYRDALGLRLVHTQEQGNAYTAALVGFPGARLRIAQLALPDRPASSPSSHDVELVEYVVPRGLPSPARRCDPGTAHLAFAVADIDATYQRLRSYGVRFVSAPNRITAGVNLGGAACYFLDPDDHTLELVQPPPARKE
ncbi:VOC family protein [Plantactinospora sp. WMMC1484]|uniref:VOC family protein n=1 Tax=Plantactinospora sp. WMMC1484 TaxID=3404122 RepID=UPI003BF5EAAC